MVLSVKVPDTITSWVASAFAMSNSSGLGISKPTSLKVFQPFFVSLTLPYSVIRGEEVSVIATVFNYENKCLAVSVALMQVTAGELFTCCLHWLAFARFHYFDAVRRQHTFVKLELLVISMQH